MRTILNSAGLLVAIVATVKTSAFAEVPHLTINHYLGSARVINLITGAQSSQKVLLTKTLDPLRSAASEISCYQPEGKSAALSKVYMSIQGNSLTIADAEDVTKPDALTGTGTLYGEPWNWNYLKFSMNFIGQGFKVRVEDVNFHVKDRLIARKQLFSIPNGSPADFAGTPIQLWEGEVTAVNLETYQNAWQAMACPGAAGQ